jgi:putative hemolysin
MQIDIEKVLATKAPKLAKKLPRFLIRYLIMIVHQQEINEILAKHGERPPFEFIRAALSDMGVTWRVEGMERVPKEGRYIFASNHPFGGMDGVILAQEIEKHLGDARSISNDILMFVEPLAPIFLPVNKHGKQSREAARIFEDTFAGDVPIQTFPAGLCSRKIKGEIIDLEWHTNFVKKALQHRRDVVPVYVEGKLSKRFYNIAIWRKRLGIKMNIEMLYLPSELFKQRNKTFTIKIGQPIPYSTFDKSKTEKEWAQWVKEITYSL